MYKQTKWLNWASIWPFRREVVQKLHQLFFKETRILSFNRALHFSSFSSTRPSGTLSRRYRGFPYSPSPLTCITFPVIISHQMDGSIYYSWWFYSAISLSVNFHSQHSMGLNNCRMILTHHYHTIWSSLTALNFLWALPSHPSLSTHHGNHGSFIVPIVLSFPECHTGEIV